MNYGYDYSYSYGYSSSELTEAVAGILLVVGIVALIVGIFTIICQWKLFKKVGKPGWAAIVPIYNIIVMLEIAKMPTWNIVLFLIPFANIYVIFKLYIELAHRFGKSTGFGIGLIFLPIIFLPMLAFGKAIYEDQVQNYNMYNQPVYSNQPMYTQNQMNYNAQPMNQVPQQGFTQEAQSLNYNQQQVPVQPQTVFYCPQCGQPMTPDAMFCSACGYKR